MGACSEVYKTVDIYAEYVILTEGLQNPVGPDREKELWESSGGWKRSGGNQAEIGTVKRSCGNQAEAGSGAAGIRRRSGQ